MAHLVFDHVTLQYPIYSAGSMSLRNQLVRVGTGGKLSKDSGNVVTITALDNVSFELKDGDSVGLIGHNGAGKSTLLRAMAGIYQPAKGKIIKHGKVGTIFEIGAGMDPELTGYENIFRMGMLLGLKKKEIVGMIPEIESFTDLGNFLAMPTCTYSSGMTMRLMFAVATAVQPEILLLDEMFGTGDAEFQERAEERMTKFINGAKIFVFASHSTDLVRKHCKRIFKLEHGTVVEEIVH